MSFNGSGVFSINTTGQPVVAATTISASVFNAFTADVATGLSTCMLKNGTQTATAGIGFFAGTVSLPGIYLGTDTATGLYRIGLNNNGYAVNGTKLLDLSAATFAVTGAVTISTTLNVTGTTTTAGLTASGAVALSPNNANVVLAPTGTGVVTIAPASAVGNMDNMVIGATTARAASVTTLSATGVITSTLATGTAPFTVASTTNVPNLNASSLSGATFAAPGAIGGGTPGSGAFTTLSSSGQQTSTVGGTFFAATGSTTGQTNAQISNTGGSLQYGIESNAGGALISGTSAYSGVLTTFTATALALGTNSAARVIIGSTGVVTIPNLAGAGTRNVVVDANGVMSAP